MTPLSPNGKLQPKLTERGYIETNDRYETSLPNVYAAGDIIGPPWLAHVASREAIQAVEGMFGEIEPRKLRIFPGGTYCQPQVASVGLTERAAKQSGRKFRVGKFPFSASGKARAIGETDGFVKLIIGSRTAKFWARTSSARKRPRRSPSSASRSRSRRPTKKSKQRFTRIRR